MDILTHAIVGAAVGVKFESLLSCVIASIAPDIVLGTKRKFAPTVPYKFLHSVFPVCALYLFGFKAEAIAWATHIVLDIPTHGPLWSPRLLSPFSDKGFTGFHEWEFFNTSWKKGLVLSAGLICLTLL